MIRAMRPAPLVRNGQIDAIPDPDFTAAFPAWANFGPQFAAIAGSVGLISRVTGGLVSDGKGTGFLVTDSILLTNIHVLDDLSNGVRKLQTGQAVVQFGAEIGNFTGTKVDITEVVAVHDTLDACLLRLATPQTSAALAFAATSAPQSGQIAAVGFPYPDSQRNPAFCDVIFGGRYGFKRVSPGLITGFQPRLTTVYHDCSTLGGNSGSPVLSLESCQVVGIHRGGGFSWKNVAIDAPALTAWIAGAAV